MSPIKGWEHGQHANLAPPLSFQVNNLQSSKSTTMCRSCNQGSENRWWEKSKSTAFCVINRCIWDSTAKEAIGTALNKISGNDLEGKM